MDRNTPSREKEDRVPQGDSRRSYEINISDEKRITTSNKLQKEGFPQVSGVKRGGRPPGEKLIFFARFIENDVLLYSLTMARIPSVSLFSGTKVYYARKEIAFFVRAVT
jgi:hypothetical protein